MLTVIEFFSLPGAGKTTVSSAAVNGSYALTRKALSAAWQRQSLLSRARYVARGVTDLANLIPAARLAWHVPFASPGSLLRMARLLAKTHWLRSHEGVLVLDQGFLQDLWSMLHSVGGRNPEPAILSHLLKALYQGTETTIVIIEVDPQIAATRVSRRTHGHSRFDLLRGHKLVEALSSAVELQGCLVEASAMAGLRVETMDGLAPVHSLARQLRSRLHSHTSALDGHFGILPS